MYLPVLCQWRWVARARLELLRSCKLVAVSWPEQIWVSRKTCHFGIVWFFLLYWMGPKPCSRFVRLLKATSRESLSTSEPCHQAQAQLPTVVVVPPDYCKRIIVWNIEQRDIPTGETSPAITPFHFFGTSDFQMVTLSNFHPFNTHEWVRWKG